jgi:uncharacterized protein (UPF0333 family)
MSISRQKGQAMLEYAILIAVVIAALIIMQMVVKRGYQGNLKDSSSKMGDQYSVSSTSSKTVRTMPSGGSGGGNDQIITEETATNVASANFVPRSSDFVEYTTGGPLKQTMGADILTATERRGGKQTIATASQTQAAKDEVVQFGKLPTKDQGNYEKKDLVIDEATLFK